MPSSLSSNQKARSIKGNFIDFGLIVPDFIVPVNLAAANFTGANSGVCVFTVPSGAKAAFLGLTETHATAGNNPVRVKKVVAGNTSAAGAAADANNIDLTAAIATSGAANTPQNVATNDAKGWAVLNAGDRLCIASSLGVTTLADASFNLRLIWM